MGHIQNIEEQLRNLLDKGDREAVVKWVKEAVLQSYRNGLKLGMEADPDDVRKAKRFAGRIKAK